MRAKQKQDQLKNKITSVTGMPDEVILGASVINILGCVADGISTEQIPVITKRS